MSGLGILGPIKKIVKAASLPSLYVGSIFITFKTAFKDARWGLFLLVFLVPQPNLWHKLFEYPFGKDILDYIFVAVLLGIFIQGKGFAKTNNTALIIVLIIWSYFSLWNSSLRYALPLPISSSSSLLVDWKNYAQMIFLYFLVVNVVKDEDDQKKMILLMSIVILLMTIRSSRNFTGGASFNYQKRDTGPFWSVGLGANHYGSFLAVYGSFFLGLFFFTKDKLKKYLYIATMLFSTSALLFTYSRGAYLAIFAVFSFFSLKKRVLLIPVLVLVIAWQFLLPPSVVDRINMTENTSGQLESSAAHRIVLWKYAVDLFYSSPIIGVGFRGFGINMPKGELTDTHNYYLLALCEQGVIGLLMFIFVLLKSWVSGWRLFRLSESDFHRGLGFGFMGCVIAFAITNMFGDRWSYFPLGGYFWIIWGLVDRSLLIIQER